MLNDLIELLVIVIGLAFLSAPILAVITLRRLRDVRRDLTSVDQRLDRLEQARREKRRDPLPETPAPAPLTSEAREEDLEAPQPAAPEVPVQKEILDPGPSTADDRPLQPLKRKPSEGSPSGGEFARLREKLGRGLQGVEWERWIGVRGAAVVGGSVMALAAILFFRHAFVNGWIKPEMRVVSGIGFGIASILVAARLRTRAYSFTPNALEGAGVVALYSAIWAADHLYELVSMAVSFPAMSVVTALACFLSLRHRSLFTALLGLLGGFATPLLLSTGSDRPIALFGYVLFLDLGLCFVARRGAWPIVGSLAMVGTLLMQGLWIYGSMDDRMGLGLVIAGLFAVFFVFAGASVPRESRLAWLISQVGSLIGGFVFAFYFATRTDLELGEHLWPTALLLGLLNIGASVVGRMPRAEHLPIGAALASSFVGTVWFFHTDPTTIAPFWELTLSGLLLIAIPQLIGERFTSDPEHSKAVLFAAALANGGWTLVLVYACSQVVDLDPWAPWLGLVGCTLFWIRHSVKLELGLVPIGSAALGFGLVQTIAANAEGLSTPDARLLLALPALVSALMLAAAWMCAAKSSMGDMDRLSRSLNHGAWTQIVVFAPLLVTLPIFFEHAPWLGPLAALVYGGLVCIAAMRLGSGTVLVCGLVLCAQLFYFWQRELLSQPHSEEFLLQALLWTLAAPVLLLPAPLIRFERFRAAWVPGTAAGLFLAFCYVPAWPIFQTRFPNLEPDVVWVLALIGLLLCGLLRKGLATEATVEARRTLGWMACVSLLFVSAGLADILDGSEEEAIFLSLFGVGLACVGRRLRLAGPPILALASSSFGFAVLGFSFLDDAQYRTSAALIGAWVSYFHLVPAVCFALVAWTNAPHTPSLFDKGKQGSLLRLLDKQTRVGPALACIVTIFLWLNLVVSNVFETSTYIRFFSDRPPEQDLALSIAWGLYAVALLSLGAWSHQSGLRWTSLALFIVTLGKAFLHDLGHLEGLYRVGSLAALAFALLFVSLFYQRFVFRTAQSGPESDSPSQ